MSRRWGGLNVDVHQLRGNCFALYVRLPGGWQGLRRIVHTHPGPCQDDCEVRCEGQDDQSSALIFLVSTWAEQARPVVQPFDFRRRPLDEVIADIAAGLRPTKPKRGSHA